MRDSKKQMLGKVVIGLAIGYLVVVVIFAVIVIGWLLRVLFGDNRVITTDISEYEEVMSMFEDDVHVYSGFMTFPETIPDSATDIDFYSSQEYLLWR